MPSVSNFDNVNADLENRLYYLTPLNSLRSTFGRFYRSTYGRLPEQENVVTKRTFSLSQMNNTKLVWALSWREKVHEYEPLNF